MTLRLPVLAIFLGLSIWAGVRMAEAADIRISSGEHEDFSRLVLRFPERIDWQFGRVAGGYEIRVDARDTTYALADVFRLIPRDRIKDIQDLGDGRLFLEVDCECYGDAFDLRGGEVAVDIKDGRMLAAAQAFNQNLPNLPGTGFDGQSASSNLSMSQRGQADAGNASILSLGTAPIPLFPTTDGHAVDVGNEVTDPSNLRAARHGLPLFLPVPVADVNAKPQPTSMKEADMPVIPEPETHIQTANFGVASANDGGAHVTSEQAGNHVEESDIHQRVAETETALLEQIGRAAAQGLLQPNIAETEAHVQQANAPLTQTNPHEGAEPELPQVEVNQPVGPEAHVSIQNAIDREITAGGEAGATTDGLQCPSDYLFDVARWGNGNSGATQIGTYRTGVLGEFDSVNPEAVLALARHYIYLTFGVETRALIEQFEPDLERPDILLILAEIMDDLHSPRGKVLEKYLSCPGMVAIWAVLSQQELASGAEVNTAAITAAFSEFPVHLRRYLGPALAGRLIKIGETETATTLRNAIERAEGDHGPGIAFLDAEMAITHDNSDRAIAALEEAVNGDSKIAPDAVLKLIEYKLDQGLDITEREIANAASHAFEHRGTELGPLLATAEIKALAQTARFSDAFSRLAILEGRMEIAPRDSETVRAFIVGKMAQNGSDAIFLRHMLVLLPDLDLPSDVRFEVSKRLADLGFAFEAREVMGHSAKVPDLDERRLFAQIAIAEGKHDVALGYLAGLGEVPDLKLRAQALTAAQDLEAAAQVFEQAGDFDSQLRASWRAGDWENVAILDQGATSQASQRMLNQADHQFDLENAGVSLSSGAEVLTHAEGTRDIIADLLGEFVIP